MPPRPELEPNQEQLPTQRLGIILGSLWDLALRSIASFPSYGCRNHSKAIPRVVSIFAKIKHSSILMDDQLLHHLLTMLRLEYKPQLHDSCGVASCNVRMRLF